MEKKKIFKTAEFWCFLIAIAEFLLFLLWGTNLSAGDEMGFALITIYAAIPITAFILCTVATNKNIKSASMLAILMVIIEIFFPFIIFGTFEIGLSLVLSLIPCAAGLGFGYFLSKRK